MRSKTQIIAEIDNGGFAREVLGARGWMSPMAKILGARAPTPQSRTISAPVLVWQHFIIIIIIIISIISVVFGIGIIDE